MKPLRVYRQGRLGGIDWRRPTIGAAVLAAPPGRRRPDWKAVVRRYGADGGTVWGSPTDGPCGVDLALPGGTCRLRGRGAWAAATEEQAGLIRSVLLAGLDIEDTADHCASAGGVMGIALRGRISRPLARRWRALCAATVYQGPQTVVRAWSPDAVEYDLRAAYWHGLCQPMPVRWGDAPTLAWRHLQHLNGVARATVRVVWDDDGIPPLPVRIGSASSTVWPTGLFRGAWPIAWLRHAEATGCVDVLRVHDAHVCDLRPWMTPLADLIGEMPRPAARAAYTRLWGVLQGRGGWRAPIQSRHGVPVIGRWSGGQKDPVDCGWPGYRPDAAGVASMYAALQVIDYAATLPPGALLGAHVDAVWAAAGPELPVPPGAQWKLKGSGTWRAYAPGVYGLGERVAVSGWQDPSEPTMSDLVSFGEAASTGGTSGGRWWHGDPAESRLAWSQPLHLERAP